MAQIAGLSDSRKHGPPADIGTFQFAATTMVFKFTFSGTDYTVAIAAGVGGWTPISHLPSGTDEVVINAAITYIIGLGGGGSVFLGSGIFVLAGSITAPQGTWKVSLIGTGQGTILKATTADDIISLIGAVAPDNYRRWVISDMFLNGEGIAPNGIHTKVMIYSTIRDIHVSDTTTNAIYLESANYDEGNHHTRVLNCFVVGLIVFDPESNDIMADNLYCKGMTVGGAFCKISNIIIISPAGVGIGVTGTYNTFTACEVEFVEDPAGFSVSGSFNTFIASVFRYFAGGATSYCIDCTANSNLFIGTTIHGDDGGGGGIKISAACMVIGSDIRNCALIGINARSGLTRYERVIIEANYIAICSDGIQARVANSIITGNNIFGCTVSGINFRDDCINTVVSDNNSSQNITYGISLENASNCMVSNNIFNENDVNNQGLYDGIRVTGDSLDNLFMDNICNDNDRWGINITVATCLRNWVKNNQLQGNTAGPFNDAGTDTKLATIPLYIVQYNNNTTHEDGVEIDEAGEWASFVGQLPLEVQQVVRFEIWAVGLAAPGAGNQMCLEIEIEGGADDEPLNTHDTGALAGQLNTTEATAINDIIHWVCTDANALALLGGDSVKCVVRHNVVVASDIATDATFRRVLVHVV